MNDQKTDQHSDPVKSGNVPVPCSSDEYYKQYLHSLFGDSIAEYFLSSSYLCRETPPWYSEIKNSMRDKASAEALWEALRQRSAEILKKMESNPSKQVDRILVDWKEIKSKDQLQLSALRFMFRSAQYNQAYTTFLLHKRPLSLLHNPD